MNKEGKQRTKSDEQSTKETSSETSDSKKSKPKEIKKCPFLGCDSSGSVISGRLGHYTTTNCPLAREQRRRERKMVRRLINGQFYRQVEFNQLTYISSQLTILCII